MELNTINPKSITSSTPHKILLIIGESGCGKTTLANILQQKYNLKSISSFTTRPMRQGETDGIEHTFITREEYNDLRRTNQIVASTYFDNNYYGATLNQVLENDIYVIDMNGFYELKEYIRENNQYERLKIIPVYISMREYYRRLNMRKRGDNLDTIERRLLNDLIMFKDAREDCDYVIPNKNGDLENTAEILYSIWLNG